MCREDFLWILVTDAVKDYVNDLTECPVTFIVTLNHGCWDVLVLDQRLLELRCSCITMYWHGYLSIIVVVDGILCVWYCGVKKFRFFIHLRYTCVPTKQGVLPRGVLWGRGLGGASVLGEGSVFTQNTWYNTLKNSKKHSCQTRP